MRIRSWWVLGSALFLACGVPEGSEPFVQRETKALDLPGARNDALKNASARRGVPVELLMALAQQQGRFELPAATQNLMDGVEPEAPLATTPVGVPDPSTETEAAPDPTALEDSAPVQPQFELPADPTDEGLQTTLAADEDGADPEAAAATATDNAEALAEGSAHDETDLYGVMFLTGEQVKLAAQLTGIPAEAIKVDTLANVDAAAALLVEYAKQLNLDTSANTVDAWAPAVLRFVQADADSEVSSLTIAGLKNLYLDGFDIVTEDGERIALQGAGRDLATSTQELTPGAYPKIQFIAASPSNYSDRSGGKVRFVVIHDIEGTMAGAIAVFRNPSRGASAHYIIRSSDGHIVQMVSEAKKAWHAGHGYYNANSIGIEHEGFADRAAGGGFYNTKLYTASSQLTCAIAKKYKIPVDRKHIFGHGNVPSSTSSTTLCSDASANSGRCGGVSHHHDPGKFWDWTTYMKLVARCVNGSVNPTPTPPPATTTTVKGLIYRGSDTSRAIAGATVRLGTKTVKTDAKGYYEIAGVAKGTHTISASASGYVTKSISRDVSGKETWGSIGLSPAAPAGTAVLTGVIYRTVATNRIAGATVKLSNGRTTTSNADGVYQFTGLAPGTYTITASKSGIGSASTSRAVTNGTTTWGSVKL